MFIKNLSIWGVMALADLNELDKRLYEFIKVNDYESKKWSTPDVAKKLGVTEEEIYQSLANLTKHIKDNVWVYYKDGGLRVVAE